MAFLLFIPMASTVPNSAPLIGLVGVLLTFTVVVGILLLVFTAPIRG